ncbi:MAG TPA: transketolase C-terminal domain-containing protein [Candidatus Limnocylindrales bacterium]|nr:transketolase C-terminal domain-containing protein [Candidatus Limnocylindrales bacterium]
MTMDVTLSPPVSWAETYAGPCREHYRRVLLEMAREDERIICVDSDMGGFEDSFEPHLPQQYVNVGIAEANMMGIGAGLAHAGRIPFVNTISSFAAARSCEQVKIDIAGNNLPVRIVVTHGGLSAGHYGPTHHAVEDVAIIRTLPNMTVIVPADAVETELAVRATAGVTGPVFLRLGRAETPLIHQGPIDFAIGRAMPLRPGDDVTIVACGAYPVHLALQAHERLARAGIGARVLNMHTVRPIDVEALARAAEETKGIVTIEDHLRSGGMGGAVCEVICEHRPRPVRRLGVGDGFLDVVGDELELLEAAGVSADRLVTSASELCR